VPLLTPNPGDATGTVCERVMVERSVKPSLVARWCSGKVSD